MARATGTEPQRKTARWTWRQAMGATLKQDIGMGYRVLFTTSFSCEVYTFEKTTKRTQVNTFSTSFVLMSTEDHYKLHLLAIGNLGPQQSVSQHLWLQALLQTSSLPNGEAMEVPHHRFDISSLLTCRPSHSAQNRNNQWIVIHPILPTK